MIQKLIEDSYDSANNYYDFDSYQLHEFYVTEFTDIDNKLVPVIVAIAIGKPNNKNKKGFSKS